MSCPEPPVTYADPRSVAQLAEPLRTRIAALIAAAPTGGLVLVSGRRSIWQQWQLRHQRCPGRECDPGCKGNPTTALPGHSNHQRGLAADLGGRDMAWARSPAQLRGYGLDLPVPGEDWHFEATTTPPAIDLAPWNGEPAPTVARVWRPIHPGDTDRRLYVAGGLDNEIAELQLRLIAVAELWHAPDVNPGPVDGDYGPRTQNAVISFKRRIIALQQATGQHPWDNADANVGPLTIAMLRWWTP